MAEHNDTPDMESEIRKYALQNAVKFNGIADPKSLVGKVMGQFPKARDDPKAANAAIQRIVAEVNALSPEHQMEELQSSAPELLEKKVVEKREGLKPLPDAEKGKVVMRFAPSPSGPMHLGHAMTIGVISEYCRMYDGKLILRIEDTNPENIHSPAYEMLPVEGNWLTDGNIAEVIIQSDRLDKYYDYIEKFIDKDAVYVCDCDPEEYKEKLSKSIPCDCRQMPKEKTLERWKMMLDGTFSQGDAVVRLKTDITHQNPAMRDFPLARINEAEHPRQGMKYRVWPLMNLSVFVDDVELGMTHILRGKDHADNAKRQQYMYDYLGLSSPYAFFQGRINFPDLEISCSKTRKLIEEGKYEGWDDIRLPFIAALRRRGYQPNAFIKWAVSMGGSLNDKTVMGSEVFKNINFLNKEILEPIARRYFFISEPVAVRIEGAPEQNVDLDLHPENLKGGRPFFTNDSFIIAADDYSKMKQGKIARLMDCINYVHEDEKISFHSLDYQTYKEKGSCSIIHWLPDDPSQTVVAEVVMPDNIVVKGRAEKNIEQLKVGDIIQFERFGFCRLDSIKDGSYKFWFAHR